MSDTPTPTPAPETEVPKETFFERVEEAIGIRPEPVEVAPVAGALPAARQDRPWWVTSDPTHPVNRDAAEVAQEAAQKASDEGARAAETARQLLENARAAVEKAEAGAAAAIKRAEDAEAKLAALVPPPESVSDPDALAPGEVLTSAGPGWVQTSSGRRIVDLNGMKAAAAGLAISEPPATQEASDGAPA